MIKLLLYLVVFLMFFTMFYVLTKSVLRASTFSYVCTLFIIVMCELCDSTNLQKYNYEMTMIGDEVIYDSRWPDEKNKRIFDKSSKYKKFTNFLQEDSMNPNDNIKIELQDDNITITTKNICIKAKLTNIEISKIENNFNNRNL